MASNLSYQWTMEWLVWSIVVKKAVLLHAANWKNYAQVLESFQGIKLEEGQWPIDEITSDRAWLCCHERSFFEEGCGWG